MVRGDRDRGPPVAAGRERVAPGPAQDEVLPGEAPLGVGAVLYQKAHRQPAMLVIGQTRQERVRGGIALEQRVIEPDGAAQPERDAAHLRRRGRRWAVTPRREGEIAPDRGESGRGRDGDDGECRSTRETPLAHDQALPRPARLARSGPSARNAG